MPAPQGQAPPPSTKTKTSRVMLLPSPSVTFSEKRACPHWAGVKVWGPLV